MISVYIQYFTREKKNSRDVRYVLCDSKCKKQEWRQYIYIRGDVLPVKWLLWYYIYARVEIGCRHNHAYKMYSTVQYCSRKKEFFVTSNTLKTCHAGIVQYSTIVVDHQIPSSLRTVQYLCRCSISFLSKVVPFTFCLPSCIDFYSNTISWGGLYATDIYHPSFFFNYIRIIVPRSTSPSLSLCVCVYKRKIKFRSFFLCGFVEK